MEMTISVTDAIAGRPDLPSRGPAHSVRPMSPMAYFLLGIVFATIGVFVALMGVDAMRKGHVGHHKSMIASGLLLAGIGVVLAVV